MCSEILREDTPADGLRRRPERLRGELEDAGELEEVRKNGDLVGERDGGGGDG